MDELTGLVICRDLLERCYDRVGYDAGDVAKARDILARRVKTLDMEEDFSRFLKFEAANASDNTWKVKYTVGFQWFKVNNPVWLRFCRAYMLRSGAPTDQPDYWAKEALADPKGVLGRIKRADLIVHVEKARTFNDLVAQDEKLEDAYLTLLDQLTGWTASQASLLSPFELQWQKHKEAQLDNLIDPEAYTVTDEEFVRQYVQKEER